MFEKAKAFIAARKMELLMLVASGAVFAESYVDFGNLSATLSDIGTVLFPGLVQLIVGAVPALIVIAVVGLSGLSVTASLSRVSSRSSIGSLR
jgi:hypothetical protein